MNAKNHQALADAFAQLHGEVFASGRKASMQMQRNFLDRLPREQDHRRRGCDAGGCEEGMCLGQVNTYYDQWNMWGSLTGDWSNRSNIGPYSGYNLQVMGITAGADHDVTNNIFLGGAFGYDTAHQSFDTIRSHDQIGRFRAVLYGGWHNSNNLYTDGYAGYSRDLHRTRRDIYIGDKGTDLTGKSFSAVARSKYADDMFSTGFEIGKQWYCGRTRVTPSIGLHHTLLSSPGVTETGGSDANLRVYGGTYQSLRMPIGVRLNRTIMGRHGVVWTPELRAFYIRELADDAYQVWTSFNGVREVRFMASTGRWGRNSARLGGGVNARLLDWLYAGVDYDLEAYDRTSSGEFSATLGMKW
jgi:outer membrane autotransporter protein